MRPVAVTAFAFLAMLAGGAAGFASDLGGRPEAPAGGTTDSTSVLAVDRATSTVRFVVDGREVEVVDGTLARKVATDDIAWVSFDRAGRPVDVVPRSSLVFYGSAVLVLAACCVLLGLLLPLAWTRLPMARQVRDMVASDGRLEALKERDRQPAIMVRGLYFKMGIGMLMWMIRPLVRPGAALVSTSPRPTRSVVLARHLGQVRSSGALYLPATLTKPRVAVTELGRPIALRPVD